ncbi:hypothetical protein BJV82DRAFT_394288 [Fennellomyces sp. T-0311]|nr:hypothetical protein BJV82DRAFT_394288 [Fennellomyces sp. T-0311]
MPMHRTKSYTTPSFLTERLLEKCNEFETVCDQIYYILEQSKRVLQLDWQQRTAAQDNQPQQQQNQQQQQQQGSAQMPAEDMGTDLSVTHMDLTLDDMDELDNNHQQQSAVEPMDEDDMDELLQLQMERLERLRNVIVHGVDVESLKDNQSSEKDDLLF